MYGFGVDEQLVHFGVHLSQGPKVLRPSVHGPKRAGLNVTRTKGRGTKHQGTLLTDRPTSPKLWSFRSGLAALLLTDRPTTLLHSVVMRAAVRTEVVLTPALKEQPGAEDCSLFGGCRCVLPVRGPGLEPLLPPGTSSGSSCSRKCCASRPACLQHKAHRVFDAAGEGRPLPEDEDGRLWPELTPRRWRRLAATADSPSEGRGG